MRLPEYYQSIADGECPLIFSAKTELQFESSKHRHYHESEVLEALSTSPTTIANSESDLNLQGPSWSPVVEAEHVFELNGHIVGIRLSPDHR